jgi:hypothetical protein
MVKYLAFVLAAFFASFAVGGSFSELVDSFDDDSSSSSSSSSSTHGVTQTIGDLILKQLFSSFSGIFRCTSLLFSQLSSLFTK